MQSPALQKNQKKPKTLTHTTEKQKQQQKTT